MATTRHPHETEHKPEGEQPAKPLTKPADLSDPENPKWGATVKELADALEKAWTPPETCTLMREWAGEDKALTVDECMLRLFRKHPSYDGTIRKAYGILSGDDPAVVNKAMKKIYDKVQAEMAGVEPVLGITRVM